MNVLLIEDDKQDEEVIRRFMPPENHVECVRTLTKAIELVDEKPFHLILLDLGLPDSWGIETFTSLRAAAPLVPIVVLTGLDDDGLAVRTIREGAQDFLVKGHLDSHTLRCLGFAVERERLVNELREEQEHRRQLEETLRQREVDLAHLGRVALMGEVTAEIAHEISQPLQAVANLVSALVLLNKKTPPNRSELVADLSQQIDAAIKHAQTILVRTRSFVSKKESNRVAVDVAKLIGETILFVNFECKKHAITFSMTSNPEPLMVLADKVQIQQVFVNLFRNAFDAIKDRVAIEGPAVARKVDVRCLRQDGNVEIEVEDSGGGLDLEIDQLFAPFVTTKANGLGMGLAICYRIVRSHEGTIEAISTDQGTVFRITLPQLSE